MTRLGLPSAWALLAVAALLLTINGAADLLGRAASPEATVRRYFAALEADDVDAALDAIDPTVRPAWTPFVENGVRNEYRIVGIAVRHPSVLAQLRGDPAGPRELTVFLDITQAVDGARWQAGPRVPIVLIAGRWYLGRPPLAPET